MRVLTLMIIAMGFSYLSGCGVKSSIPSGSADPTSESERAVAIVQSVKTATGTVITCELNESLVSPSINISIFLEYEGTEIERSTLNNEATFTFAEYNPPADGEIVCVVEFADAEFESEALWLVKVP